MNMSQTGGKAWRNPVESQLEQVGKLENLASHVREGFPPCQLILPENALADLLRGVTMTCFYIQSS